MTMIVQDVIDMVKVSSLANTLAGKKDDALIKFVNLGVSELFRRFNMSIKVETVLTDPNLALYELRSPDISLLLSIYDCNGKALRQTDVMGSHYDYKIVNWRSFLLRQPKNEVLLAVYSASSPKLTEPTDILDIPDSMMDALLCYVAYMGQSTINKDNVNEANIYYQRFEMKCQDLENQGYRIPLTSETVNVHLKGYV